MSKPFDLELKNVQKRLDNERSDREEQAKKLTCPQCKQTMFEAGCVGIRNQKGEREKLNGDYCMSCYSVWLSTNVPKFE